MKKIAAILLAMACYAGGLTGCATNEEPAAQPLALDDVGDYTGFADMPDYTREEAEAAGYIVAEEGDIIANGEAWDAFAVKAAEGSDAAVRLANFQESVLEGPYFQDVFFQDEQYYLFDSSTEPQTKEPFPYLLSLEGQFGNPSRLNGVIVLARDSQLTFEDVMHTLLSSTFDPEANRRFKLVRFYTPESSAALE
ncbi:hypothetical protein [Paenibacillus tepidiphilus]|uniref:hypothetical protein n=1 Tax=Paenibacillus tepidiphilus TaxID=2608683 RepID=UPI00123B49CC|nr:hypothetical protein [Paenibacillus tepidiphilus]